ncbi:MAG: hypothetical protein Q9196_000680 [Gyalolechia fulgens]
MDAEDIDFKFFDIAGRTNKDCRKRWAKIHGPIKKGSWSTLEDQRLKNAVTVLGHCVHRKRQQSGQPSADRPISNEIGLPTPDCVDSDGADSDSMDSSSDENTTELQDTSLINALNTTTTSFLRSLPESTFQFPNAFDPANIRSTAMIPQSSLEYPFDGSTSASLSLPDHNDYYSDSFYQQQHNLPLQTPSHQGLDHYATDRTPFWKDFAESSAPSPAVMQHGTESGHDRRKGLTDLEKSGDGASTLILEDVQPRMASRIMEMLFEAKATVKMKIVRSD